MNDNDRKRLCDQLQVDEGFRAKPYRDTVGKLTIGYGRNLDDIGISTEEARFMLDVDMKRAESAVLGAFPWYTALDGPRQAVIVNMAFNVGLGRLRKFEQMIVALEKGDFAAAAREMLDSLWSRQVGERSTRLARQMQTGRYEA